MPGSGVHGGKHARALVAGLREIVCENGRALGQHAREEARRYESGSDRGANQFAEHIYRRTGVIC